MKCYNHNDRDAVSQCLNCGKGLCYECSQKYNSQLCISCSLEENCLLKKQLIKRALIPIPFFILGFCYMDLISGTSDTTNTIFDMIFRFEMAYAFGVIPFGWTFLKKITPRMFLSMPIIGWIIYFSIKFTLSELIGLFITPYKIYRLIKDLKNILYIEKHIKGSVYN